MNVPPSNAAQESEELDLASAALTRQQGQPMRVETKHSTSPPKQQQLLHEAVHDCVQGSLLLVSGGNRASLPGHLLALDCNQQSCLKWHPLPIKLRPNNSPNALTLSSPVAVFKLGALGRWGLTFLCGHSLLTNQKPPLCWKHSKDSEGASVESEMVSLETDLPQQATLRKCQLGSGFGF